jgi:uncharacterized protein (DUF1800 family)
MNTVEAPPVSSPITRNQASRFLQQAAFGGTAADIVDVQRRGYAGWIDHQLTVQSNRSATGWLIDQGLNAEEFSVTASNKGNHTVWRKLLSSPDVLRQRVTFALSQIVTLNPDQSASGYKHLVAAHHWDTLSAHAFSTWDRLLVAISLTHGMSGYLTYRKSRKADAITGTVPDENYARELMQLFSIGLYRLRNNGTKLMGTDNQPLETYTNNDVTELARVFTGWRPNASPSPALPSSGITNPLVNDARFHDFGSKRFLGTTLPANLVPADELRQAIQVLVNHPSSGPFICRQLIQRLVFSSPDASYLQRVVTVWNNNGSGVRGDLAAVVRAVLLDPGARSEPPNGANLRRARLREPVQRVVQWARTFGATTNDQSWGVGDMSGELGQSPLRPPSVFNFFRPGYVPPNLQTAAEGVTLPEFQITTETQVAGYANTLRTILTNGLGSRGNVKGDYSGLTELARAPENLLAELNTLLAAGQLSSRTLSSMKWVLESMPARTGSQLTNRVKAGILMLMVSPEYLVQK